ncbi:hypothetical protein DL765_001404 [Monosporascus sp. GIB2]|nr:hypothetical protein DL765_001404 [Monosporascus sp. GIB2]
MVSSRKRVVNLRRSAYNSAPAPEATGNKVLVEFNLAYRWHSATSKRDEGWITEDLRRKVGDGVDAVRHAPARHQRTIPGNPEERGFAGLWRSEDGTYSDDVVGILAADPRDGTREGVARRHSQRRHFGLNRHETFGDINPDHVVAGRLVTLYDSPDAVELYPGLVSEKPKPPMSSSEFYVNVTTSRAILSDAVSLVRGDRFYTTDYSPGHVMYEQIFPAFPNHFGNNSVRAHFPFVVPAANKAITRYPQNIREVFLGQAYEEHGPGGDQVPRGRRPGPGDTNDFHVPGARRSPAWPACWVSLPARAVGRRDEFLHSGPEESPKEGSRSRPAADSGSAGALKETSFEVDIMWDVIVPLKTRFVAEFFRLSTKTAETPPRGVYVGRELHLLVMAVFTTGFFGSKPRHLGQAADAGAGARARPRAARGRGRREGWLGYESGRSVGSGSGASRLLRGAGGRRVGVRLTMVRKLAGQLWSWNARNSFAYARMVLRLVYPSVNRFVIYPRSTAPSAVEICNGAGWAAIHGAAAVETPGAPLKKGRCSRSRPEPRQYASHYLTLVRSEVVNLSVLVFGADSRISPT